MTAPYHWAIARTKLPLEKETKNILFKADSERIQTSMPQAGFELADYNTK